jgi:hypothetical protein
MHYNSNKTYVKRRPSPTLFLVIFIYFHSCLILLLFINSLTHKHFFLFMEMTIVAKLINLPAYLYVNGIPNFTDVFTTIRLLIIS